jgi:hypothetical protein
MSNRVAVTLLLPAIQANALLYAARCAGTLDSEGRVRMDHFILARDAAPLDALEKAPSRPVQTMFEAEFNGA